MTQDFGMLKWLWVTALVIALDLVSKAIVSDTLILNQPLPVFPGFNLTLMHNTGAAFSFLSEASGWQRWFFTLIALAVSAGIILWLKRLSSSQLWLAVALAMILGGALGNVYDRITLGYVVDFIQVFYDSWYFPAFNVADSSITVGAVILIIDSIRSHKHHNNESADSSV